MGIPEALRQSSPGLADQLRTAIEKQQLNQRAEQTYLHWIDRFVLFHDLRDPSGFSDEEQQQFLAYLRDSLRLSRARLNQARQALMFFYADVLGKPVTDSTVAA
ncbi:site-specific integrase [Marinobacter oulmenensis]|uniref:Integrase SAM-like N-terminal domain-containing protein n=1 Tax=Marinobacter oulmenensis TaxID=643747 RepID=A0A840UAP7_9GAMM|nr:site-specific integrase [Marinobacter oulmenensis]MBB5319605.1 hypothetical protein [Marinobacter oulmenensis]